MGMMMHRVAESSDERAENQGQVVRRLVGYLRPYWRILLVTLVMVLLTAVGQAAGPFLIGRAIDVFISGGDTAGLGWTVLALAGVYFLSMLATALLIYTMSYAGQQVLSDLRAEIMISINRLSLENLEGDESGDLMSRLVNDIDAINSFLSQGLAQSLGALFSLLGIVVAMFLLEWRLALAALLIVPFMLLTTRWFSSLARRAFRRTRETIGDVSADLQEELGGVKVAQAFNRTDMNVERFARRNAANRDANVSANAVTSAFAPAMDVLSTLDTAIVAGYGGYLAVAGSVSVGTVVAFLQYVQNFFRPIQTVAQLWTLAQSAFAAAERVFELIDEPAGVEDAPDAVDMPPIDGRVVFAEVTFAYTTGEPVLEAVNLEAEPGQTVALVGPTGAGKSTLVGLIARFYDPQEGQVFIDGVDVRTVRQRSLRGQMGMVTQDPFLFSGTVLENIRYGRLEADDEAVFAAARVANAHDFIERLPKGYATQVGERGGMLSLGQRQLIAIARAVLADPRLLILDEATASVDTRTEALIQRALDRLLKGRTSFVIAHRLSTIRNADQVVVIDDGRIVERGTHDGLLEQGGLYADLYARQFYEPEAEPQPEPAPAD